MRYILLMTSIVSFFVLSGCQNKADIERQNNLVDKMSRHYSVTQKESTDNAPKKYEFCGEEGFSCPALTEMKGELKEERSDAMAE